MTLRDGKAYYGLEAEPVQFETALRALAEGHSLRATARIIGVDKDTVCAWLDRGGPAVPGGPLGVVAKLAGHGVPTG